MLNEKIIDTTTTPRRWDTTNHKKEYVKCPKCKIVYIQFESDTKILCRIHNEIPVVTKNI